MLFFSFCSYSFTLSLFNGRRVCVCVCERERDGETEKWRWRNWEGGAGRGAEVINVHDWQVNLINQAQKPLI